MRIRLQGKWGSAGARVAIRPSHDKAAYTLVEVMVAGAILAFVAISLYGAFSTGFSVIQTTREDLRATQIMVQKLEAIRLFTWSQICDTNSYLVPEFVAPYDPLGVTNNSSGAQYTGFVTAQVPAVGEVPEAYRTNMRTITVTVYWTNYYGGKPLVHERDMQTRVARNGMQNYIWGAF